jgi:hypothetical protein
VRALVAALNTKLRVRDNQRRQLILPRNIDEQLYNDCSHAVLSSISVNSRRQSSPKKTREAMKLEVFEIELPWHVS